MHGRWSHTQLTHTIPPKPLIHQQHARHNTRHARPQHLRCGAKAAVDDTAVCAGEQLAKVSSLRLHQQTLLLQLPHATSRNTEARRGPRPYGFLPTFCQRDHTNGYRRLRCCWCCCCSCAAGSTIAAAAAGAAGGAGAGSTAAGSGTAAAGTAAAGTSAAGSTGSTG